LMSLAWKIMMPLGLLNLIAVAIVMEMCHPAVVGTWIAGRWGDSATVWITAGVGWLALFVGLVIVATTQPIVGDNRPRRDLDPMRVDSQLDFDSP
jgi:NADH-quinone oxidoreductase subunit H